MKYPIILAILFSFFCYESNAQLNKKKIIVTAPNIYNKRLCSEITRNGGFAIPMPTIKIEIIKNNPNLDSLLNNISDYKYIILPSRNAIKAYFERAVEMNISIEILNSRIYAVIGKDVDLLHEKNIEYILTTQEASTDGIVNALSKIKCIKGEKIAVLCPKVIGLSEPNVVPDFISNLKKLGLNVTRLDVYTTEINIDQGILKTISDIKQGNVDLIAFTSSAEIEALITLIGGKEYLQSTNVACFGPFTAYNARKLGLKPAFVSKNYSSFKEYVLSMIEFFK